MDIFVISVVVLRQKGQARGGGALPIVSRRHVDPMRALRLHANELSQ